MSDIAPSRILHPGELAQHPLNSNTHSPAHIKELAESRKTFGQYRNIVVWTCPETIETENARGEPVTLKKGITYVLAGNGFHQAAMLRGDTEIEVKDRSDLSFDESLLLIEADNASPLGSQPDPAQLRANLERARTLTVDRPGLEAMLERAREAAGVNGVEREPPPEPPEVTRTEAEKYQEVWQVKPGDVWQLGRHIVGCVDSTDEEVVKGLVGDAVVTFVWADPPYGIEAVDTDRKTINSGNAYPFGGLNKVTGTDGSGHLIPANRYSEVIGDDTTETAMGAIILCNSLFSQATQVWWGANHYSGALPPSPCWVIWDKRVDIPSNDFADGEMAWVNLDLSIRIFRHRWSGLVKGSEHNQRRVHPTQKPVALPVWCFEKYGNPGDVIFDGFLGSGISILAAEQLNDGRRVIGCELAPEYVATVLHRFQQLTSTTPHRLTQ